VNELFKANTHVRNALKSCKFKVQNDLQERKFGEKKFEALKYFKPKPPSTKHSKITRKLKPQEVYLNFIKMMPAFQFRAAGFQQFQMNDTYMTYPKSARKAMKASKYV